jgi:hypothetical protein
MDLYRDETILLLTTAVGSAVGVALEIVVVLALTR